MKNKPEGRSPFFPSQLSRCVHPLMGTYLQPRAPLLMVATPSSELFFLPSEPLMIFFCNGCHVWGKEKEKQPT